MEISGKTKLHELFQQYPFLLEFLVNRSPKFKMLNSAVMRNTVGKVAPLAHVAERGGIPVDQLISEIVAAVKARTGEELTVAPGEKQAAEGALTEAQARQEALKGIIRDLHDGADMASLKRRFHELIKDIEPTEIARMEQQLIAEGMPESEIKRLCDVHVQLFKDSLEKQEAPKVPAGHPLHTYMLENRAAEAIAGEITDILAQIDAATGEASRSQLQQDLVTLVSSLVEINYHYLRKENQLFPVLEQHDISGPTEVMWAIHDDIRQALKQMRAQLAGGTVPGEALKDLLQSVSDMIYKEEQILFPMALEILDEGDWRKVRQGEEEIGYAWVAPEAEWGKEPAAAAAPYSGGEINLDTGRLTPEVLNLMLTHLPVDISFVNERDEVAYYSQGKERIFPRSPGVIGRKVQNCHPQKSLDMVQKILDEFRAGKKDTAEFWIQMGGRFIHIRYFAVRDAAGNYKGCLEVSQDATEIRALEGERRLLDWA
ncbi:MAG TPA: DUF438 domain-containing protein [Geomonas sp.]|nr:DUF438 domain-containing protein [Geomonas sp.]